MHEAFPTLLCPAYLPCITGVLETTRNKRILLRTRALVCLVKPQLGGARYSEARQVVCSLAHNQSQLGHLAFMPESASNTEPHITAVADVNMSKHYKTSKPCDERVCWIRGVVMCCAALHRMREGR